MPKLQQWLSDLADLLQPRFCPVCGNRLAGNASFICAACSTQWPRLPLERYDDNLIVRAMWASVPVTYGASLIVYRHESPFHELLTEIKYRGGTMLAHELGRWAVRELQGSEMLAAADMLVPVPLSRRKLMERGYNQALMIAQGMAEQSGLPVREILSRHDRLKNQASLGADERRDNAEDIYEAHIAEADRGKHILLVDDVMTTGATLIACTRALLKADPTAEVSVFTVAHS